MKSEVLYKYRGLSNLELVLDILVDKRLYACHFEKLNDPMEGRYIYARGSLTEEQIEQIRGNKGAYNVLSLSATHNNLLMWSYYGEGHTGLVVGVKVTDKNVLQEPVHYVNDLRLNEIKGRRLSAQEIARLVLCKKLDAWTHEREKRVFKLENNYVDVEIKELYLGTKADKDKVALVSKIAEAFLPDVKIQKLKRKDLDSGSGLS